jgi:hypothetical protein
MTVRLALLLPLALVALARAEIKPISWEEAGKHVGEVAIVEGRVLGVHCSQLSCLLAFEPTFNGFTAVVQAENFKTFPPAELEQRYSGRKVRVRGKIVERDGKPEIILDKPESLTLGDIRERREARETERARSQTEIMERLADVLDRIEELTERMVGTQERIETMLAAIEQRESQVAAYQPPAPQPAPSPGYGDPQPRPAYERLRTLKRGMSAADVQRLVGPPQYVEKAAGGGETWYYGYGRSVSFNARGRAEGMIGFATP